MHVRRRDALILIGGKEVRSQTRILKYRGQRAEFRRCDSFGRVPRGQKYPQSTVALGLRLRCETGERVLDIWISDVCAVWW